MHPSSVSTRLEAIAVSALQEPRRALVESVQVGTYSCHLNYSDTSAPHLTVSPPVSANYRIKVTTIALNQTEVRFNSLPTNDSICIVVSP